MKELISRRAILRDILNGLPWADLHGEKGQFIHLQIWSLDQEIKALEKGVKLKTLTPEEKETAQARNLARLERYNQNKRVKVTDDLKPRLDGRFWSWIARAFVVVLLFSCSSGRQALLPTGEILDTDKDRILILFKDKNGKPGTFGYGWIDFARPDTLTADHYAEIIIKKR